MATTDAATIRHCVMFTWNDDVSPDQVAAIAAGLDGLARLEGVVSYRHGPDLGLRDGNWDYVVVGDFASDEAYASYASDPGHLDLISSIIAPAINTRAAVQYRLS